MHQMSPGVERAVRAAHDWAKRLQSDVTRLSHFVLGLLEEEEGRPAVLIERLGLSAGIVREHLAAWSDAPGAPAENALFQAARNWSLAHRQDPEFLTDALLVVVLQADVKFQKGLAAIGLDAAKLEQLLKTDHRDRFTADEQVEAQPAGMFAPVDTVTEMSTARVLDANFNRAREAARVLEDYCRFARDDRFLTEQCKALRHDLTAVINRVPAALLLAARETLSDVGTSVAAPEEYHRRDLAQVALANAKRLQESLRSLEEFGKLFAQDLGRDLEALRYRAYTLERAIDVGLRSRDRLATATLYLLLTGEQCPAALDWTIERAAAGGVDIIQLREKSLSDGEFLARARDVRRLTRKAGLLFIVNDRPDLARLAEADGVHLGQDDLSIKDARHLLGPEALIGRSTHSVAQLRQAVLEGADYLGIGPVFPSRTKEFQDFPGVNFVAQAVAETSLPAFALGGVEPGNIAQVLNAGARRIAVGAAIARATDPEQVSRLLKEKLMESQVSPPETVQS